MKVLSLIRVFSIVSIFCTATAIICSAQLTTLHSFSGADGANPAVGLVKATDGNFYGTTHGGGTGSGGNAGTAFKITPNGSLITLYNFCQSPPHCTDGLHPLKMIQGRDGNFYGVTDNGDEEGDIFKLTPSGHETVLFTFCSILVCTNGNSPTSLIQANDGNFYGVDFDGGAGRGGAFWRLLPNGTFSMLYAFVSTIGLYPTASLVQGRDGNLYGVAPHGGSGNPNCSSHCGTVFKITLSGSPTVLYNFCSRTNCTDGATPSSALVQGRDGNFYGATSAGGANGAGEIFKITPGGALTVLHSFVASDGGSVYAPLTQGADGNFYGTANTGGAQGDGTIFEITPRGTFTVLHSFNGSDGANSSGALVEDGQGTFYGTTNTGGASNLGTVYRFKPIFYTLTVSTNGSGVVTSADGSINCPSTCSHPYPDQSQVTLTATPATGWAFTGWGGACSGTGSCHVTMTQNTNVSATFTQLPVTLTVSVAGNGAVTSTDGFINCPSTCTHTYQPNTPVTLHATAASGWIFSGWTGACIGVGSCNLTMTQNLSVTGVFVEPGHGIQLMTVTPCRLVDTRQTQPVQGGTSQDFAVPQLGNCHIPATAAAYSLNVTVVPHGSLNYLTIWPTGEAQPLVSTMNSYDGRIKANAAIVPAGTNGAVSVYVTNTTDLILDIDGYFATPASGTLQFYSLTPCRLVDTRLANGALGGPRLRTQTPRGFPLLQSSCIPSGLHPLAYSLNFTVVPNPGGQQLGYLTVWPTGDTQPIVSTLNNPTATVVANGAIVPAGTNGDIDVYAYNTTDLLIDINGYFAAPGTNGLSLYPAAPCRVLDTRQNNGPPFRDVKPVNVVGSPCAPPASALAYVFNATVVPPAPMLYLTLWPEGDPQPIVSTLNANDGFVTSNMAIVPSPTGSIDAYAYALTQLILDISGYFAP